MSLTYKQIQDAVLASAFDESDRASAKNWILFRHSWLWDLDEWSFKQASANVAVTSGSQTVGSLPSDFKIAVAMFNADGDRLQEYRNTVEFQTLYNANLATTGTPEAFTVRNGVLLVGPTSSETSATYILEYEKQKPALSADGDTTGLPADYDLALVHAAKAEGFKLSTVPGLSGDFDADFQAAIEALRRGYLTEVRSSLGLQWPAYRF